MKSSLAMRSWPNVSESALSSKDLLASHGEHNTMVHSSDVGRDVEA